MNDHDARILFKYRLSTLAGEVLDASDDKEVIVRQREHGSIRDFMEWIDHLSKQTPRG